MTHFLEKRSFHDVDVNDDAINMDAPVGLSSSHENYEYQDEDDESIIVNGPRNRIGMMVEELVCGE